jgi:hypothetical protein
MRSILLAAGAWVVSLGVALAAPRDCENTGLNSICNGCLVDVEWTLYQNRITDEKRWCSYPFEPNLVRIDKVETTESYGLGEVKIVQNTVKISGLYTGKTRLRVRLTGTDRYGKPYSARVNFNITVLPPR